MENKQYPPQEPEKLTEEAAVPAAQAEEDAVIIEELTFSDEPAAAEVPVIEEIPAVPEEFPATVEEIAADALPVFEEAVSEEFPSDETDAAPAASIFPEEEPPFVLGEMPTLFEEEAPSSALVSPEEDTQTPVEVSTESEEITLADESANTVFSAGEETDPALEILRDPTFAPTLPPEISPEGSDDQQYSDVPSQPEPEAVPVRKKKAIDQRPTRKGRPKRKKGEGFLGIPNLLVTFVWLGLILAIGVTLGRMLWVSAADVLAFGRPDQKVTITVYEADTIDDVIDKLHKGGLIRYKSLFKLYADISDAEEDIKPGIYDLNTRYDYHALVNFMSPSSTREVVELTIPEGYTCRQIYALLEENRVCTSVDIASYAADGDLSDYWFLEYVDRGSEYCLEGFLFPDTYQFYKNSSPREALEKMLDNFDHRFSEEMRAQIDMLNANVTGGGYGVREIVIVASLIEKESAAPAESPTIASVIYNRLFDWDYPALLNIDAAIVYAQGGDADTIDTSIDSPYNTYRNTGLTPTPIANPGLSSLKAALNPESSDYYFYVLNPDTGMHQFSTTQEEHDGWIREFYN